MLRRLLPWLLALSLVLNGIGGAMASVSMHAGESPVAPSEHHQSGTSIDFSGVTSHHLQELAGHHGKTNGDCDDDCCRDSGTCQCLCLQHSQALTSDSVGFAGSIAPTHISIQFELGHLAPPPGERLRPPIC